MKTQILAFSLCLLSTLNLSAQTKIIETTLETKEAELFRYGAVVSKSATISFPAGKSELRINNLAPTLDLKNIEIMVTNDVSLSNMTTSYQKSKEALVDLLTPLKLKKKSLKDSLVYIRMKNDLISRQIEMIQTNSLATSNNNINVSDLKDLEKLYETKLSRLLRIQVKNKFLEEDISRQITFVNQKIQFKTDSLRTKNMTLKLQTQSSQRVNAEVILKYYTGNAKWHPVYEVRAESGNDFITLVQKVNFYQNTGEDWINATISFNNSDPKLNQEPPNMMPYYITHPKPIVADKFNSNETPGYISGIIVDKAGIPLIGANVIEKNNIENGTITDIDGRFRLKCNNQLTHIIVSYVGYNTRHLTLYGGGNRIVLNEGELLDEVIVTGSSTGFKQEANKEKRRPAINIYREKTDFFYQFTLKEPITLNSGISPTEEVVEIYEIPSIFAYHVYPKQNRNAFLSAEITNWGDFDLLSGATHLYLDNKYKGDGYLDTESFSDTLKISLGRDQSIIAERTRISKDKKKTFWKNKFIEVRDFEIVVRNKKSIQVPIVVHDQFPLSDHEDVEIELKSAAGAAIHNLKGFIEWKGYLPSNTSKKFSFSYELKYPTHVNIF